METFTCFVEGLPIPQGSMSATPNRGGGRFADVFSGNAKRLYPWRDAVTLTARRELSGRKPFVGPVAVDLWFVIPRPKNHYGTGKNADRLNAKGKATPAPVSLRVGDIDKLSRAVLDALTYAGVFLDDSLVVELMASKRFQIKGGQSCGVGIMVEGVNNEQ